MQLSGRDLELLRWINGHGIVESRQVAKWMGVELCSGYARLRRLVRADYLLYEKIFHQKPGIYRVTPQGRRASDDSLPALRKVKIGQYNHDLLIVDLDLHLIGSHSGCFIPERRIRQAHGRQNVGQRGHVSDGVWQTKECQIAIEVELSSKGRVRRDNIIRWYLRNFTYKKLWYFYGSDRIKRELSRVSERMNFVSLVDLKGVLHDSSHI